MKNIIGIVLILFFASCAKDTIIKNQVTGAAFGTSYSIIYPANEPLDYQAEIDSVFGAVNKSLSTYIPNSDISKINAGDSTIRVDHMFRDVFELSKEVYESTDGYFDPTVGTLVNAWGFGPEEALIMDPGVVDSLLHYVGFNKVELNKDNTISKADSGIYFDFNAIAKGYAIDRLAVMLSDKGQENYLIEVGGEIVAKGINSQKQQPWVVGIDDPQATMERASKLLIQLEDRALASSGNYRKYRIDERTGEKYVHTIDPKTGWTKNSNTLGVTILANDCATADAFATAFMAMDLDKAFQLVAKRNDLEAFIIYVDEKGQTQQYLTPGFERIVLP
jgi:thiamine biosynthesis lipoprotein